MAREDDPLWAVEPARLSRRKLLQAGVGAAGALAVGPLLADAARRLAAAGAMQPPSAAGQISMADLVAAAK
jgi:hypothetical protein